MAFFEHFGITEQMGNALFDIGFNKSDFEAILSKRILKTKSEYETDEFHKIIASGITNQDGTLDQ